MTQQQREAIASMLRALPFNPAGDLREQRPLFEKMIAPAPASAVLPPASYSRLQKIKAAYDPGQAVICAHLVRPTRP